MTRRQYKALRQKLYKTAGEVGTLAESQPENHPLSASYRRMSEALDQIDILGEQLGFINPETNDFIDRRFKLDRVAGHWETKIPSKGVSK